MAFFPRYGNTLGADFAPLFRLLDEGLTDLRRPTGRHTSVKSFSPRFDVNEHKDSYQLHGELPGIDQKNIEIEFTDPHTLVIKGRNEYSYSSGEPALEDAAATQGQIEDTAGGDDASSNKSHQATVEDENEASTSTEVTKTVLNQDVAKATTPTSKYKSWVSERSVGEFHRSFSFPNRVDQDAVKASLKDGILSVIVPKAKAPESRKINIE